MDAPRKQPNPQSSQALQKKIRSLSRFTTNPPSHVPATHLADAERALVAHKAQLRALKTQRHNEKIARRYHMVRFFERKKAEKRLRRAREQLRKWANEGSGEEGGDELRSTVVAAETDVEWIRGSVWERGHKYVALYAGEGEEFSRPESWWEIRRQVEDGKAGTDLAWPAQITSVSRPDRPSSAADDEDAMQDVEGEEDNRTHKHIKKAARPAENLTVPSDQPRPSAVKKRKEAKHTQATSDSSKRRIKQKEKSQNIKADSDESDGGFFE